jgi:hypothetical protein
MTSATADAARKKRDQAPTLSDIAERNDEEDPNGVTNLRHRDEQADAGQTNPDGWRDLIQKRLRPIQVSNRGAACGGEQKCARSRHHRRRTLTWVHCLLLTTH